MKKKKIYKQLVLFTAFFLIYFLIAARPVPREIIITPKWINSLESENAELLGQNEYSLNEEHLFPFTLDYKFGYINSSGKFFINKIINNNIYLSDNMWTEYPPEPSVIEIKNIEDDVIIAIENPRGYPVILDNRIFILGSEQNALSEYDHSGNLMWTYEFGSILTDMDVAAGLVVAVSIDGIVEILNSQGRRIYFFQPGGSRLEVIYGCAISRDGSLIGIISGYDPQRFILLEKFGTEEGEYRVISHESLDNGFRRAVRVLFIDNDRRVIYERQDGISCYNIRSRKNVFIPLDGEITAIENSGDNEMLFLITKYRDQPMLKELIGIRLPRDTRFGSPQSTIFLRAPFKSENVYLGRVQTQSGSILVTGGGNTLISFDIEER